MNFRLVSKETKLARTVADPDLQIRGWGGGGGGGGGRSSRPRPLSEKGEPGLKKTFSHPLGHPLGPQFGLKITGAWEPWDPPLDLPLQGNTSGKKFPHTDPGQESKILPMPFHTNAMKFVCEAM